ncbi:hypothetical protein JTB14_016643 [Gonioctena quinquepunctata]|nr:hypothetical protein JTB14_016643 [Gonioctena quinquepunctata]
MEPLLLALESQPGYKIDDITNVSNLAFADDILLLAQDVEQARRQLRVTEAYIEGLVPHYLHRLTLAIPSLNEIRALNQDLRVVIRKILHLPHATTNGLLYCGKKDGGLGIPRLEWLLTSGTPKAGLKFADNPDPVLRALAAGTKMESRLKILAQAARINWPADPAILKKYDA